MVVQLYGSCSYTGLGHFEPAVSLLHVHRSTLSCNNVHTAGQPRRHVYNSLLFCHVQAVCATMTNISFMGNLSDWVRLCLQFADDNIAAPDVRHICSQCKTE